MSTATRITKRLYFSGEMILPVMFAKNITDLARWSPCDDIPERRSQARYGQVVGGLDSRRRDLVVPVKLA
jgi:hypothetical protein